MEETYMMKEKYGRNVQSKGKYDGYVELKKHGR
jgi:hypothetical protein